MKQHEYLDENILGRKNKSHRIIQYYSIYIQKLEVIFRSGCLQILPIPIGTPCVMWLHICSLQEAEFISVLIEF